MATETSRSRRARLDNRILLAQERRTRVVAELSRTGYTTLSELVAALGVSVSTVRRDLTALAAGGRLLKVHGGAHLPQPAGHALRPPATPSAFSSAGCEAVARAALEYVERGTTIGIGAGPSCEALARNLVGIWPLAVVTNSIPVARALGATTDRVKVTLCGGNARADGTIAGQLALNAIAHIRLDTVFVECTGLDIDAGLTCRDIAESATNAAFSAGTDNIIALASDTAWARVALSTFARLDDINALVVAPNISAEAARELRRRVRLVVATDEPDTSRARSAG